MLVDLLGILNREISLIIEFLILEIKTLILGIIGVLMRISHELFELIRRTFSLSIYIFENTVAWFLDSRNFYAFGMFIIVLLLFSLWALSFSKIKEANRVYSDDRIL